MKITYNKLWKILKDRNIKKTDLLKMADISSVTLAKLSKDENVSTETLIKICDSLQCNIQDIIESIEVEMNYKPVQLSFFDNKQQLNNYTDKFKVIDLFCGIGGFSYGFKMTNHFEVILGADIWETALNTFKRNHGNTFLLHEDLTKLDEDYWSPYKNKIDVIIAGPPCQGFSMSGKRQKEDKRNSLFKEVVRITSVVQPKYVIIENVVGLLSMSNDQGKDIKQLIIEEFNKIGYNVTYKVLNAADYGVPQARHRVIFIISKNYPLTYPAPFIKENDYVTVGDALGNVDPNGDKYLPATTTYQKTMQGCSNVIHNHVRRKSNDLVTKRMSFIPQGGNWQNIPIELGTGGGVHSNAYKRLDPKKPSITIKHAAKAMIIHPTENRILTIREVARLQSFPDDFIFEGTTTDQHQELANAVPPLLGKAIAEEIYKNLKSNTQNFTFIDLFCGMGGFRLALEQLNCKCAFSSEIDPHAIKTYELNYNETPSGDITKINAKDIPNHNILCAGFPCQAFSIAGRRKGFEDTRGTLFFDVARIMKEKQPEVVFLENVKGLTNHDGGKTLETILYTIKSIGYDYKYKVLNALDYGLPQNRERWYCVCVNKNSKLNINDFNFPEPVKLNKSIKDLITPSKLEEYTVSETCKKHIEQYLTLKNIDINENTLAYEVRPSRCQFKNNGISPTLTAKMGTGGNNVPVLVKYMRELTERECLNIMGYPEDFKYYKGSHMYKQIGNSVCVPVISLIAENIISLMKKGK
ncbi:MAG: DNA (cytosine-5-)-methyltransferase [Clostridiales bacterium]|nr:DNA (cytosine-5-)-methyltransferase [Clostridiales bacterium]